MINHPEPLVDIRISDADLTNLERLGAYFASQIHDLNNQMAVLSNAELLLEISDLPTSPEMAGFLSRIFTSIHRLSGMCAHFNDARKAFPVEIEKVSVEDAADTIFGAVGDVKGWSASGAVSGHGRVHLNSSWISIIISQLIGHMGAESGAVKVSVGGLPVRHYHHSLRAPGGDDGKKVLLVHLTGTDLLPANPEKPTSGISDFHISLELIRLMGAALSMGRSDNPRDYLLAFPMS